jgi:hypothetical protein
VYTCFSLSSTLLFLLAAFQFNSCYYLLESRYRPSANQATGFFLCHFPLQYYFSTIYLGKTENSLMSTNFTSKFKIFLKHFFIFIQLYVCSSKKHRILLSFDSSCFLKPEKFNQPAFFSVKSLHRVHGKRNYFICPLIQPLYFL